MSRKKTTKIKNAPLGEFIKTRRRSRNLTKADACRMSGLDYSYWHKLEAGIYELPSPKALDRVAKVIDVKPADLYAVAGYRIGGELPGLGPYLRAKYQLAPEAVAQLESFFSFLRHQYGIPPGQTVFPKKPESDTPRQRRGKP